MVPGSGLPAHPRTAPSSWDGMGPIMGVLGIEQKRWMTFLDPGAYNIYI